jgi:heme exporter protein D
MTQILLGLAMWLVLAAAVLVFIGTAKQSDLVQSQILANARRERRRAHDHQTARYGRSVNS